MLLTEVHEPVFVIGIDPELDFPMICSIHILDLHGIMECGKRELRKLLADRYIKVPREEPFARNFKQEKRDAMLCRRQLLTVTIDRRGTYVRQNLANLGYRRAKLDCQLQLSPQQGREPMPAHIFMPHVSPFACHFRGIGFGLRRMRFELFEGLLGAGQCGTRLLQRGLDVRIHGQALYRKLRANASDTLARLCNLLTINAILFSEFSQRRVSVSWRRAKCDLARRRIVRVGKMLIHTLSLPSGDRSERLVP